MKEDKLQSLCYQWAHNEFAAIRGLFFSVPNGGTRNLREAQLLKATGLVAGIPDMILLFPKVVGFEFKSVNGVLSERQKYIHERWRIAGIEVHIVKDFEEFKKIFGSIMK
jgi:hypothetical protein